MKKKNVVHEHLVWANVMRIVAITLVVFLHVFPSFNTPTIFTISLYALAKTCVPLFLMLSGALLLGKHDTVRVFITKRVQRMFIPWFFWAVVFLLFLRASVDNTALNIFQLFTQVFIADFTYLPMILGLYLLVPFFRLLLGKAHSKLALYYLFLWFVAISMLPYTQDSLAFPLVVDNGLVRQVVQFSGYFLLGFGLSNIRSRESTPRTAFLVGGLALLLTYMLSTQPGIHGLVATAYISPTIVILSASIFMWIKSLCEQFVSTGGQKQNILTILSTASFGVFLSHPLIIQLLQFMKVDDSILYIPLTIALSFSLIIFLQRIPELKRLVG